MSFAGIDVPVKVFGAADPQGVQFRELHEPDGAEIAHELVDADGRKVDRKQVVKGFEVRSGEYVVLDDDELKAVAAPKRKTVEIEHFVPREQIDPDAYDRKAKELAEMFRKNFEKFPDAGDDVVSAGPKA